MSQVEEIVGLGTRFWIIVSGGKKAFTAKWWDPDRCQQVADHFKGRILFVQCGEAAHHHPRLKNLMDLVGETNLREVVRLVYHADGIVMPQCKIINDLTPLADVPQLEELVPPEPPPDIEFLRKNQNLKRIGFRVENSVDGPGMTAAQF